MTPLSLSPRGSCLTSITTSGAGSGRPLVEAPAALVLPEGGREGALGGFMDSSMADLRSSLSKRISHSSFNAKTLHEQQSKSMRYQAQESHAAGTDHTQKDIV